MRSQEGASVRRTATAQQPDYSLPLTKGLCHQHNGATHVKCASCEGRRVLGGLALTLADAALATCIFQNAPAATDLFLPSGKVLASQVGGTEIESGH